MTIWAILPAAGIGRRMGSITPKQYLSLNGATVIESTLRRLLNIVSIKEIVVVLNETDSYWSSLKTSYPKSVRTVTGGGQRYQSVLNGLNSLEEKAEVSDWVLVHDAVRPCVREADIEKLIATLQFHAIGGVLGSPVADTLKEVNEQAEIQRTIDRSNCWNALTPQMFRYGILREALEVVASQGLVVTDEAAAIELLGHVALMVKGKTDNIKITTDADLELAGKILELQQSEAS
jgi:2-C-methyl-D-erythritol 4-phosphate cytidylyltransferase